MNEDDKKYQLKDDITKKCDGKSNEATTTQVTKKLILSKMSIMHLNIQGIAGKRTQLEVILENHPVDILCISEHWLTNLEMSNYKINNYNLVNSFCRENHIRGGICIFAKPDLNFKSFSYNKCIEKSFEVTVIVNKNIIKDSTLFIITIYRSPNSDIDIFIEKMYELMCDLYKPGCYYIACGDINIDLLNKKNKITKTVCNLFSEFNLINHINTPTRITNTTSTGIDVLFSNFQKMSVLIQDMYISDHTLQICKFSIPNSLPTISKFTIYNRDYSEKNLATFRSLIAEEQWLETFQSNDLNIAFNYFFNTYLYHYNVAFPYKNIKKQKRKKNGLTVK